MINRIITYINKHYYVFFNKRKFQECGKNVIILNPLIINGKEYIKIGNSVRINYKSWIEASCLMHDKPSLIIKSGSVIGRFNHIYSTKSIVIEQSVLTADRVYISDNLHKYENVEVPIINQGVKQLNEVVIGEGSWLGEGVCVIGAKIGKHCVIGANAVVTKDIPDYSIAVGVPAKVIKKYDFKNKEWRKI